MTTNPDAQRTAEELPVRKITLLPASQIRTERLDWLIDNWVPRRSLTLLAGREGLGKSTIACRIAADATLGKLNTDPINVAYLNTEDSRSITVKPRLQAAGADMERVFFIDVTTETGTQGALSLPGDMSILTDALVDNDVKLVILDAAKSAMHSGINGNRDEDVRQFLDPIAAMCDKHDIATIGLVHFGKKESSDSGVLILGSIAWSQVARSVLSLAFNKDNDTLVCTNTKGNLASEVVSREVRLESRSIMTDDGESTSVAEAVWGGISDVSAMDLMETRDGEEDESDTVAWLRDYLSMYGETPKMEVEKAAGKDLGISSKTVRRTFRKIGGVSRRVGFPPIAYWSLPDPQSDQLGHQLGQLAPDTNKRVPIDPIGADQQKRNVPIGEKSQLGHGSHTDPNEVSQLQNAPKHQAVWPQFTQLLDKDHGLTTKAVKGSFVMKDLERLANSTSSTDQANYVEEVLEEMAEHGQVRKQGTKYLKAA